MKNFSTQKERILQLIEFKSISKNKFYIETGISNGTLDKKSGFTMDTIEKIYSTYPEINLEWLITGNGSILKSVPRPTEETHTKDELEELRKRIKEQAQLIELLNEKLETYKKQDVSRTTHARS